MKSKSIKKILLVVIGILIIGQFIRPNENISNTVSENDISNFTDNTQVLSILKKSCFDCHSNHTTYPWYAKVFPVSWYLYNHVEGGKKQLNFSEFGTYELRKKNHVLEEILETINEERMPLASYTRLHKEAVLTEGEKIAIENWVNEMIK